ncbi:hypothetical protein EON67_09785, partial [archaeon]
MCVCARTCVCVCACVCVRARLCDFVQVRMSVHARVRVGLHIVGGTYSLLVPPRKGRTYPRRCAVQHAHA